MLKFFPSFLGDLWNPAEEFGHLSAAKDQNPSAVHVVEVRKVHGEKYQKSPKKWKENEKSTRPIK